MKSPSLEGQPVPSSSPQSSPSLSKVNMMRTKSYDSTGNASPSSVHSRQSSSDKSSQKYLTLIDEADEALAQSLLMFLYADLRLLSATGRIYTKFETLCIDSDIALKHTSAELAAVDTFESDIDGGDGGETSANGTDELPCSGISPSQIMAALMLEIKQEVEEHERLLKVRSKPGHKWKKYHQTTTSTSNPSAGGNDGTVLMDEYNTTNNTDTNTTRTALTPRTTNQQNTTHNDVDNTSTGYLSEDEAIAAAEHEDKRLFEEFIFTKSHHKKKFFQAEEDMHSLLKAYNEMIKEDQNPDFKGVNARRHLGAFLSQADELVDRQRSQHYSPSNSGDSHSSSDNSKEFFAEDDNGVNNNRKEDKNEEILFDEQKQDLKNKKKTKKWITIKSANGNNNKNKLKHLHPDDQNLDYEEKERPPSSKITKRAQIQSGIEVLDVDKQGSGSPRVVTNDTFEDEKVFKVIFKGEEDTITNDNNTNNNNTEDDKGSDDEDDSITKTQRLKKSVSQSVHAMFMDRKQALQQHRLTLKETRQAFIDRQYEFMEKIKHKAGQLVPEDQELGVAKEMADVGDLLFRSIGEDADRVLTPDEVKKIMERAVTSRVYGDLNFMADFFKPGTVSRLMAQSKSRVVWLNDWYPIKDLVYAISVDKEKKRVQVVFRGAITQADWHHAYDLRLRVVPNPVKRHFQGRRKTIEVYHGFYRYLFRPRKDTGGSTKYDEICSKVHKYGMGKIGSDYEVVAVGFSLGAALATLFGLYASTDERFTNVAPIKMFTFGSPMVGGHSFADSFRHQELTGKLQYARFINARDSVAHFPLNLIPSKRGSTYVHVGVEIWVPRRMLTFSYCQSYLPKIHYPPKEGWIKSYWRALRTSGLFNMPWPWRIKIVHSLDEHKRRLNRAKGACDKHTDHLANKSLDEVYQLLVTGVPSA